MKSTALFALLLLALPVAAEPDPKTVRTWKAKCSSCHGADGKADTEQARKMGVRSVNSVEWQRSFTDEQLRAAIRDGLKRTTADGKQQEMTGFKGKLQEPEIDALAAYMRSLGPPVPATKAKPAEAKPVEAKPAEAKPAEAKPAEAKPAEAKPVAVVPAAGLKLWKAKCASCHGTGGKGKKGKSAIDMTAGPWQLAHDDAALTQLLGADKPTVQVNGKTKKHFSPKLKPAEVDALVRIVRSLGG